MSKHRDQPYTKTNATTLARWSLVLKLHNRNQKEKKKKSQGKSMKHVQGRRPQVIHSQDILYKESCRNKAQDSDLKANIEPNTQL